MKVAIITFHRAINYGAVLQAYALQKTLNNNNISSDIIDYRGLYDFKSKSLNLKELAKRIIWLKKYVQVNQKKQKFNNFLKKNMTFTPEIEKDELSNLNELYDCFISGSDQVWNLDITKQDSAFFLDFVDEKKKRKTYAASFGYNNIPEKYMKTTVEYLSHFSSILVRESGAAEWIRRKTNLKCDVVCDPTFFLDASEWNKIEKKPNYVKEPFIIIYTIAQAEHLIELAIKYSKQFNYHIYYIRTAPFKDIVGIESLYNVGPEELLYFIHHSKCVFTSSFHGLALSVKYNTPFVYEANESINNNVSRLSSLAKLLNIESREAQTISSTFWKDSIDWQTINKKVKVLQNESLVKLMKSLEENNV